MTAVSKEESVIKLKKVKKPITSNKSHDGKTVLKDAAERIKRLQRKPKSVDPKKNGKKKKIAKQGKKAVQRELKRGVVYIGHLPHGFYEDELKGFFKQFGTVTRVKVSRSAKTGKSKGYAFVEFTHNEVAKIVAETMNNYLMFERLVKAQYIPPEKVSINMFPKRYMTETNYVALNRRNSAIARQNVMPTDKKRMKHMSRIIHRISASINNLKEMGIEYAPQVYCPLSEIDASASAPEVVSETAAETETIPQLVPITVDATQPTESVPTTEGEQKSGAIAEPVTEPKSETIEAVEPKAEPKSESTEEPESKVVAEVTTEKEPEKEPEPATTITPRVTRSRANRKTPGKN